MKLVECETKESSVLDLAPAKSWEQFGRARRDGAKVTQEGGGYAVQEGLAADAAAG